jgi:hypothetical protein
MRRGTLKSRKSWRKKKMKKIGNLYELINDALNEGFIFLVTKDLEIVTLEEKLDELVDKYGEAIADDDELWTATEDKQFRGAQFSEFRCLEPEHGNKNQERYLLLPAYFC